MRTTATPTGTPRRSAMSGPARRTMIFLAGALAIFAAAAVLRGYDDAAAPPASARAHSADPLAALWARVAQRPDDPAAHAGLGLALLQTVRETNDTTLYARAEAAFDRSLALDPQGVDALVGKGVLALALHDFRGAQALADQVLARNPYKAAGLGIRVDSLVELGRYEEAVAAAQQMVDLRPDLESYSRVAYLRELHGDTAGAIEAMRMAADTAVPGSEPWLWTTTQLGHLYFNSGELAGAEEIYVAVLRQDASYPFAQFGLARVLAAQGNKQAALTILRPLAARLPMPEFLTALGDLYKGLGQPQAAQGQYDLVDVIQQLNAEAGMDVDLELAAFEVTHGRDDAGALAAAQSAYAERPTIYAADTLAWALHRSGDDEGAWHYSQEALRLGTQDAALHARAAAIAAGRGDTAAAAHHQAEAQRINPHYSPWLEPAGQ